MRTDDLAARRARHREARSGTLAYCNQCRQNWPCDAAVLGAALEAERQARQAAEARGQAAVDVLTELLWTIQYAQQEPPGHLDGCACILCLSLAPRLVRALQQLQAPPR